MDRYTIATEPQVIGKKLIKQYHDHLSGRRIEWLFVERMDSEGQSQPIVSKGKNIYGRTKLVTGLNAFLAGDGSEDEPQPFFVILITKYFWKSMTSEHREALIDHELAHCEFDSTKDKCSIVDHDVEEFVAIVKRHGAWNHDLDAFFKAGKQIKMPFVAEAPAKTTAEAGNGKEASAEPKPGEPGEPKQRLRVVKDKDKKKSATPAPQ